MLKKLFPLFSYLNFSNDFFGYVQKQFDKKVCFFKKKKKRLITSFKTFQTGQQSTHFVQY